ncbi:MAG: ComF family protein [Cyanobacteria bacterium P01_H01_bin.58]
MWRPSINAVTNLFLQTNCPLCDRPTAQEFCRDCWRQVLHCISEKPAAPTRDALPVLALGIYQRHLKRAIAALKYNDNRHLAYPLGKALGERWQQFPLSQNKSPWVVPIPLHADKLRERGFNQAELLADAFCQQTGLRLAAKGLVRQRATLPQFGLGVQERTQNLTGAFSLGSGLRRRRSTQPVLLLDDIYTTGTTVRTAAAVLRRQGFSVCGVAVIAQAIAERSRI